MTMTFWEDFDAKAAEADEMIRQGSTFFTEDYRMVLVEDVQPYLGANWVNRPEARRVLASDGQHYTITPSHIIRSPK